MLRKHLIDGHLRIFTDFLENIFIQVKERSSDITIIWKKKKNQIKVNTRKANL